MASLILFGSQASSLRVLSIPYNSHLRSEYNFTNGFSSKFVSWQKKQWRKCGARRRLAVQASKNESEEDKPSSSSSMSFGDRLLDYIEGGPKLRKWYGAPDQFTRDGGDRDLREQENNDAEPGEEEEEDDAGVRDAVLVTDAEGDTGQPVEGDVSDAASLRKALKGVRAVICPSKVGALANKALVKGVEHIVLVSQLAVCRNEGGIATFFSGKSHRQIEQDEAAIASCGVPYTIVRPGTLRDEPGGQLGFDFVQGRAVNGSISREDAATVCVRALDAPPQQALVFEVVNGTQKIADWTEVFSSLKEEGT
ncbi:hypothetical protein BDL97_03G133400 [Sphagnum fallax]|nr:hypothetical protein BDL97_03G133400 [Sphagnum fallax]